MQFSSGAVPRRLTTVACALVLLGGGLAACGSDDDGEPATGSGTAAAEGAGNGAIDKGKPPARFALVGIKIPGVTQLDFFKAGADAAARKINAEGGIGGREVVVDACNSQLQPSVATTCARQLVGKKPIAQFGCEVVWSATGLKIFGREKIPSFNCPNTPDDFNDEWSFGLGGGAFGYQRALARMACERDDIKKVVTFIHDVPQQRRDIVKAVDPVIGECGKTVEHVFYPVSGADLTPYINRVARQKPDFVIGLVGTPGTVQMFRGFQQAGIPARKIGVPDSSVDYETVMSNAGGALEGAYVASQYDNWADADNPQVQEYLQATEGASEDARNASTLGGYQAIMWFSEVAKQIGPDEFDGESLAEFMRTENGVEMPLSRELVNPGPEGLPQVKQPYTQLGQIRGERVVPLSEGAEEGGWVLGF